MINFSRVSLSDTTMAEPAAGGGLKFIKLAPSVLGIIVCLAVIIFVIWPKFNEVVKLRSENVQLEQRAKDLEGKVSLLGGISQKRLEDQFILSEKLIPSDKAVFSMVAQVEKAASNSGVILNKIDLVPGSVNDDNSAASGTVIAPSGIPGESGSVGVNTPRIQIKVTITSDYQSALRFLNSLLVLQRAVAITDLAIGSDTSSGGGGSLKTSMVVNAFWKPIPKELPAIETPIADISEAETKLLDRIAIANTVEATVSTDVPKVPLGRPDLFAPF